MNKEALKKLFELKLEIVDLLVKEMPEPVQEMVIDIEREVMEVLSEVATEYLKKQPPKEQHGQSSSVNNIPID